MYINIIYIISKYDDEPKIAIYFVSILYLYFFIYIYIWFYIIFSFFQYNINIYLLLVNEQTNKQMYIVCILYMISYLVLYIAMPLKKDKSIINYILIWFFQHEC